MAKSKSIPRRLRMNRDARLQSARQWVKTYTGRDVVRGYRKWFGVDTVCAIVELRQIGVSVPDERLRQAKRTEEQAARRHAARKQAQSIEEQPDSDSIFAYIAGYTDGGAPYGVRWDELELDDET